MEEEVLDLTKSEDEIGTGEEIDGDEEKREMAIPDEALEED